MINNIMQLQQWIPHSLHRVRTKLYQQMYAQSANMAMNQWMQDMSAFMINIQSKVSKLDKIDQIERLSIL